MREKECPFGGAPPPPLQKRKLKEGKKKGGGAPLVETASEMRCEEVLKREKDISLKELLLLLFTKES